MKDETWGVSITCFVGLKSNTYTFIAKAINKSKIVQCINKTVVDDDLKYGDYKNVFFSRSYMRHEMNNRAQSEAHNFFVFLWW